MTSFLSYTPYLLCVSLLLFLFQTPDWYYIAHAVSYAIIFAVGFGFVIQREATEFRLNWVSGFGVLLLGYIILSLFWSVIPSLSVFNILSYGFAAYLMMMAGFTNKFTINMRLFYRVLMGVGVALSFYTYYQFFTDSSFYENTAHLPFYNPNSLAVMLGVCGLVALFYAQDSWIYVVALVVIITAMVMTGSRAGILIFSIASTAMIAAQILTKPKGNRNILYGLLGAGLIIIYAYTVPYILDVMVQGDVLPSAQMAYDGSTASARLRIWSSAIEGALATNPIIGNGMGTFYHIYSGFRVANDNTIGMHAHNDILHLWVELGVIGILIFGVLGIGMFKSMVKIVGNLNEHKDMILPSALLIFMGGMGMLTPIILMPSLLLILTLVVIDLARVLESQTVNALLFPKVIAILSLGLFGVIGMTSMQYYHAQKMNESFAKMDIDGFYNHIEALDLYSLRQNQTVPVMRAALLTSMLDNDLVKADQMDIAYAEMQDYITESKRRNPYNIDTLYYEADLALRQGKTDVAIKALQKALSANPRHLRVRLKLINLSKNKDDKISLLKEGLVFQYWQDSPIKLYNTAKVMGTIYDDKDLVAEAKKAHDNYMQLKR